MSREIKFRIWNKSKNQFTTDSISVLSIDLEGSLMRSEIDSAESPVRYLPEHQYEIMQYTGLIDKYKKDIYEGDIVKTDIGNGHVAFHFGCFMIVWIEENKTSDMQFLFSENGRSERDAVEIIGNIYSNPDLLTN